jgi:hypothetical protein
MFKIIVDGETSDDFAINAPREMELGLIALYR